MSIYATAFVVGFFTSFGWWTAGKVQKVLDEPTTTVSAPQHQGQM